MEVFDVPTFEGAPSRDLYHSEFLENNELWIPYVKAVCHKHALPVTKIKGRIHNDIADTQPV
jgi:hypothetical protein